MGDWTAEAGAPSRRKAAKTSATLPPVLRLSAVALAEWDSTIAFVFVRSGKPRAQAERPVGGLKQGPSAFM